MAQKTDIPRKFKDKRYSFLERVAQAGESDSFKLFPKRVNFVRKEKDEDVILVVRKHRIRYVPHLFFAFVIVVVPIFLLFMTRSNQDLYGKTTIYWGLLVVCSVISINIVVTAIIQWFYNVAIITDRRIVALKVVNVFQHSYTEILWRNIQDVSHDTFGFVSYLIDIGNIYIDTAGKGMDLTLRYLPRPRDIQNVIANLVDLAQKSRRRR